MPQLWFRAETEPSRLLPPICPRCLTVGTRPLDVPVVGGGTEAKMAAYYCDRCADRLERSRTFLVARLAGAGLLGIGVATSTALTLGGSRVGFEVLLTALGTLLPLGITALLAAPGSEPALLQVPREGTKNVWLAARPDYALELGGLRDEAGVPNPRRTWWREGIPLAVALFWLAGLHWLGRAELRVMHGSRSEAMMLVDHRRRMTMPPTLLEHPQAARAVTTLAGRRTLTLVSETGEPVVEVVETLWPGRDYLFGTLPPDRCLFLERQEYGAAGTNRSLTPVVDAGPLWELPTAVDVWFAELRDRPDLPTSGGARTALRLLPCR